MTGGCATNKQQFLKGNSLSKLPPFLLHFISIIDKPSLYPQSPLHTIIYCSFSLPIPSDFLPLTVPWSPVPVSSALQFFQTLNTYSHLYPNKQAEVAQQLENLINGTTVPDSSQLADVANKKKNLWKTLSRLSRDVVTIHIQWISF